MEIKRIVLGGLVGMMALSGVAIQGHKAQTPQPQIASLAMASV